LPVGSEAGFAAHKCPQIGRRTEAGAAGDDVKACLSEFDQPAREGDPFRGDPRQGCRAELGLEAAVQRRRADVGVGRENGGW